MNAGLSNLATLKRRLLAESLRGREDWDDALVQLGRGLAGSFERYCNRLLERVVDGTDVFIASNSHWFVRRCPLETVSKIELRYDYATGWQEQPLTALSNVTETSGFVNFGQPIGDHTGLIRLTYTGGYWWDSEESGATSRPSAAAGLPDNLLEAWLLQAETIWSARDKIGSAIASVGSGSQFVSGTLPALDLIPLVRTMLQPFVRYQLLA